MEALEEARRFFMDDADVHRALRALVRELDADGIPYAIGGAMALNAHGFRRVTIDVDVVLAPDGLARFKERHLGRGYVEKFPGSRGMRDTANNVNIAVLLAGQYPGDGKPKPIAFPDPATVAVREGEVAYLPLTVLVELKLASGMTAPHRLKDLADVIELIRARRMSADFASQLHPYVREKYAELWEAAQVEDDY
jgi:hypothetical protein